MKDQTPRHRMPLATAAALQLNNISHQPVMLGTFGDFFRSAGFGISRAVGRQCAAK